MSSSQAMEKEGVIQCLTDILDNFQLDIEIITTGRHSGIKRKMKSNWKFTHIKHQFDPWHIAKWLSKKINRATKTKGLDAIQIISS